MRIVLTSDLNRRSIGWGLSAEMARIPHHAALEGHRLLMRIMYSPPQGLLDQLVRSFDHGYQRGFVVREFRRRGGQGQP